MKKLNDEVKEQIREEIQDLMASSLETFDFYQIIDCSNLTKEEIEWAKENLDWKVVRLDK